MALRAPVQCEQAAGRRTFLGPRRDRAPAHELAVHVGRERLQRLVNDDDLIEIARPRQARRQRRIVAFVGCPIFRFDDLVELEERFPVAAIQLLEQVHLLGPPSARNVVERDRHGRHLKRDAQRFAWSLAHGQDRKSE